MKSLAQELRDREKLLRDLTAAIRGTINLKGNPPVIRVAPELAKFEHLGGPRSYAFVNDTEAAKAMMMSTYRTYVVDVSETKVLGVPCQAFHFEGVLLKVLPV